MTTLRDRLVKIASHRRSIIFQMAEVMVPRALFQKILPAIVLPALLASCLFGTKHLDWACLAVG
jgi:hypothetical protein